MSQMSNPPGRDTAEDLEALFHSLGALDVLNDLGTIVSTTVVNAVPDPTVQAMTRATLSGAGIPFSLPNPRMGAKLRMLLWQDTTGSRTAVLTTSGIVGGGTINHPGGSIILTTTASHGDLVDVECFDGAAWTVSIAKANIS